MGETLQIVVQVVGLLFAVSFHESAHGLAALACGDPTAREQGRISLNPLRHVDTVGSIVFPALLALAGAPVFGWARPVPVDLRRTRKPRVANLLVSAAGPLSNVLLALAFAALVFAIRPRLQGPGAGGLDEIVFLLAVNSVLINAALALFNLLPIPPLDGFGVLESLLPRRLAPLAFAMRRYGMLILFAVLMTGVLSRVLGPAQRAILDVLLGRH
ncbi:MAG: site-2 protease family protein [Deltaproteobacteria bacterium]|nr:site-2 protease family protein [Deltaproteobacteria bacterium]